MTALEITLVFIGLVFIIGSFFLTERLNPSDIEMISKLSEEELKIVTEKEMAVATAKIEDLAETTIDLSLDQMKRSLEKETNDKMMAIDEYATTVLDSMNKSHNENMFLYGMLGDKQEELKAFVGELQTNLAEAKKQEEQWKAKADEFMQQVEQLKLQMLQESSKENKKESQKESKKDKQKESRYEIQQDTQNESDSMTDSMNKEQDELDLDEASFDTQQEAMELEEATLNHNEKILELYRDGKTTIEIAKQLGLGIGEVQLVVGLYQEGKRS